MESRYVRNRIYLNEEEQLLIKDCPIILAGSGIGSVIAECALRLGFEKMTIVDFDHVELSNLNRQNYTEEDLASTKVNAIKNRLLSINKNAKITIHNSQIISTNIEELVANHQIAINALDFTSQTPLEFDRICQEQNIHVLHPYNVGWGGLVTVISPSGPALDILKKPEEDFTELNVIDYLVGYMQFWGEPQPWLEETVERYKNETESLPPPQLSVGSWMVASMCTHLLFNICTGKHFKKFPEFYLNTMMECP